MPPTAPPPNVAQIYYPFLIGTLLATAFYSALCMQTFHYFVHYQGDRSFLKILVAYIWVVTTLHEALSLSTVYKELIGGVESPVAFLTGHPELFFKPILVSLVAVPVQGFFAYRIFIFTKRNFIVPVLWFAAGVIQIVDTIVFAAKGLYISNGTLQTVPGPQLSGSPFRLLQMLSIIVASVLDILIAIAMTVLLAREWKSPLLPRTSRMLQRLIVFAVNTGTWTAAFALTSLALLYAYPHTVLSAITTTPVCAIYANTLLANLNARDSVREAGATGNGTNTFRFSVSALPVSGGNPPRDEVSESSESSPTSPKVIATGEDVWQPVKEVGSENV